MSTSGMGTDRILDFTDGADLLDLTARSIESLADFSAAVASLFQSGGDVFINLGDGDVLTLKTFGIASLTDADLKPMA